jgi:hypothetical protein
MNDENSSHRGEGNFLKLLDNTQSTQEELPVVKRSKEHYGSRRL